MLKRNCIFQTSDGAIGKATYEVSGTAKLRVRVHGTKFEQNYPSRTHRNVSSDIQSFVLQGLMEKKPLAQ